MKNTYSFQEYDLINYLNKKRYNNTVFIILIIGIIYLIFGFNFYIYDKEILIKNNLEIWKENTPISMLY